MHSNSSFAILLKGSGEPGSSTLTIFLLDGIFYAFGDCCSNLVFYEFAEASFAKLFSGIGGALRLHLFYFIPYVRHLIRFLEGIN